MKFFFTGLLILFILIPLKTVAAEQYVDGKIARIESCTVGTGLILIYLEHTSGTSPITGNGCSNDKRFPYVRLTSDNNLSEIQKTMLSIALTAYASDKEVRIRYDDASNHMVSIAFK